MSILSKIFGDANERLVNKFYPTVKQINELEKDFEVLSDEKLRDKTSKFRKRLKYYLFLRM